MQARSLSEYGSNGYAARAPGANKYDAEYSYDPNGNLITLQRLDGNTSLRDDLTYEYNNGTNRLRNTDPADGENYIYDQIGNLISDAAEGIDSIIWTPYGKVRAVTKDDNSSVKFRYDASGNRIAKIDEGDTTVYVRDASGNVMGVYKNDTLIEQSIYGSRRLGLITSASKTGYRTLGGKKYELSNHLGNVLAVVSDNINFNQDSTWANVVNMTDYYPFGLAMDGRTVQDSAYRYGFNGQEKDDDTNMENKINYIARNYDTRLGRFLSVDPLTKQFPMLTPYQFASNTPIWGVDIDGEEVRIYTESGNYTRLNVGHTFISVGDANDIMVYTYGRYGELGKNKGSFNSTNFGGEGVLIQLKGQEAKDFIGKYVNDYGAQVYEFMDADENETKSFFENQFNGSSRIPKSGPYTNEENARVVDDYDLKCNNCTTKSLDGIKKGIGSDILYNLSTSHPKSKSGNIPVRSVLTPSGLDKDLRNAVKNPRNNIREVTDTIKENYPSPSKDEVNNDYKK